MTHQHQPIARQAGCIAIDGRAVLIEGAPGTGKSTLALALIDRGAELVGDDSVLLRPCKGTLLAHPHHATRGLIEVRNLGVLPFACRDEAVVALAIVLDPGAPRYIEEADIVTIGEIGIPLVRIWPPGDTAPIKVELALQRFGLQIL